MNARQRRSWLRATGRKIFKAESVRLRGYGFKGLAWRDRAELMRKFMQTVYGLNPNRDYLIEQVTEDVLMGIVSVRVLFLDSPVFAGKSRVV